MVTHMKTTIDIADTLLEQAKCRARDQHRTLRDVVEEALRRMLEEQAAPQKPFRLKNAAVHGQGVQPGIVEGQWWDLIYPIPDVGPAGDRGRQ